MLATDASDWVSADRSRGSGSVGQRANRPEKAFVHSIFIAARVFHQVFNSTKAYALLCVKYILHHLRRLSPTDRPFESE